MSAVISEHNESEGESSHVPRRTNLLWSILFHLNRSSPPRIPRASEVVGGSAYLVVAQWFLPLLKTDVD